MTQTSTQTTFESVFGFKARGGQHFRLEVTMVNAKLIDLAGPYHEAQAAHDSIQAKYRDEGVKQPSGAYADMVADHQKLGELTETMNSTYQTWSRARQAALEALGNGANNVFEDIETCRAPK